MNTTYLIITALLGVYVTIQVVTGALTFKASELRFASIFTLGVVTFIMSLLSFTTPIGEKVITYAPATNTKIGDDLIIQSKFSTIIVSDIKFMDKPVRVKMVMPHNAWGSPLTPEYTVELDETAEK